MLPSWSPERGRGSEGSAQSHGLAKADRPARNQLQCLSHALQTLDNSHAKQLLTRPTLAPHSLLCIQLKQYHLMQQHHYCLSLLRRQIQQQLACTDCLAILKQDSRSLYSPSGTSFDPDRQRSPFKHEEESVCGRKEQLGKERVSGSVEYKKEKREYGSFLRELSLWGARFPKIALGEEGGEGRVIARERIRKDQNIILVPKSHLITLEDTQQLPIVRALVASRTALRSPKHTQLALFLLAEQERGVESAHYPYIATLPSRLAHFPVYYSATLLVELKGTSFLEQLQQRKCDLTKDYESLRSIYPDLNRFGYQEFVRCRMLVGSRVFGIVVEGVKTDALVPLADMLNHHLPKQTCWYYCDKHQAFLINSLREIEEGAEIFDSYGQKCNSRFLLNYGFTLPINPFNQVSLRLPFPQSYASKFHSFIIRATKNLQSHNFAEMMGVIRYLVQTEGEEKQNRKQMREEREFKLEEIKQTPPRSKQIERKCWEMIERIVQNQLDDYPSSLREDKRILSLKELDVNQKNVVTIRKGEKEILLFYSSMAKKMQKNILNPSGKDLKIYEPYLLTLRELN